MTKLMMSVVLGGFLGLLFYAYRVLVLQPKRRRSRLRNQGVNGPPISHFLLGNVSQILASFENQQNKLRLDDHNWLANVLPYLQNWKDQYGPVFMYSLGNKPTLCTSEVEMVRDICMYTSLDLVKPSHFSTAMEPLLGKGILTSNGSTWKRQRKIIAPELYPEKVKDMVSLMVESTVSMLSSWESRIKSEGGNATIKVDKDLKVLAADILSRACFGSDYTKGAEIFSKLESLVQVVSKNLFSFGLPLSEKFPTKANRAMWKLKKEVDSLILNVMKEHSEATTQENDILQMLLQGAKSDYSKDNSSSDISYEKFIVDNCKNIYLAGSETSAVTMVWILFLLATNPDWQSRARAEVLHVCKDGRPDADSLRKMKIVTMVIQETMRLYTPSLTLERETTTDISFQGLLIPKGFGVQIPIPLVHRNPDIWGPDAHKFNPERFAQGLSHACKVPQVYMPFGFGNHVCAGQNFAMTELKAMTSLILSKFQFSLSPSYVHSPMIELLLVPKHGMTLSLSSL